MPAGGRQRSGRGRAPAPLRLTIALLALGPLLLAGSSDPGIVFELDRERFVLQATDLASGAVGPRLRVAVGSPAHPTPSGEFPVYQVVRRPGWRPGETARRYGARPIAPSTRGPLGVAKIGFGRAGIALHGGADPLLIGKPISLGCVRALDDDVLGLLDWLDGQGALGRNRPQPDGEIHQAFRRRALMVVR